ncbi:hypothetical protein B0H13DRAFT_2354767 [Mycena leptocephala]|nr:hypothetical protein B0H13DRAFT_2354767 [Mycena leptocephala]
MPEWPFTHLNIAGAFRLLSLAPVTFMMWPFFVLEKPPFSIGDYPNFPNLRVYFDAKTGFYFDLTSLRIGVGSAAMAQNLTDEKTLPASTYTAP